MKRSEVNRLYRAAKDFFEQNHWHLPPNPRWDITDFGLGDIRSHGLVLVNLAEEAEYCEKLMFAEKGMKTPAHAHKKKKEDIICRVGTLMVKVWKGEPGAYDGLFDIQVNNEQIKLGSGEVLKLESGERVTLVPGVYHEFWPCSEACIIGEVSTENDDANDNFFVNKDVGRYGELVEDEKAEIKLLSEA